MQSSKASPADFWVSPKAEKDKYRTGLMVNNSMYGGRTEFIPIQGKKVTWYGCGPTVYDAAHMGHARTYVAFDIIRRIMTEYFGYDVFMCMNITDIDDKIIKRSLEKSVDFAALARYWEARFWTDMKALNVQLPDVVTRVSEYIPEVLNFIEKIMLNGFAYESQGSVYFDTERFQNAPEHVYGRMEPGSVSNQSRVLEGEGELGVVTEKRNPVDFALWKKAKEGEPSWESPWGRGRPGWHIECSTMACSILGFPIDIHSGGIDLRFPHHDNELAQSEACFDRPQWVNYFLHAGHLHIKGSKMSKSLKNFIAIREALEVFSPRSIRYLTLMHRWDAPMNYSTDGDSMVEAAEIDQAFRNFFGLVSAMTREFDEMSAAMEALEKADSLEAVELAGVLAAQRWGTVEMDFHEKILSTQRQVHSALLDNFDTPTCILALRALVSDAHSFVKAGGRVPLLVKAARYTFRILRIFGVTNGTEALLDYVAATAASDAEANVMNCLASFRNTVRKSAQELLRKVGDGEPARDLIVRILELCDVVRDQSLVELGIQLEDTADGSLWKKSTKKEIQRERERKAVEEDKKKMQKAESAKEQMEQKKRKEMEVQIPPEKYFATLKADQFIEFDDDGLPLKTVAGAPVSKSQRDKLEKLLQKHRLAHGEWLKASQLAS